MRGTATNTPALHIALKFKKIELIEFVDKIEAIATGNHPIKDELLIRNAIVIANVINTIFLSNIKCFLFDLSL
jgi:uncharacterized HAD superfamily protein